MKGYDITIRCYVEAENKQEAEEELLASLAYVRRLRNYPLGAVTTGGCESTLKEWTQHNGPVFDLVAPRPKETQTERNERNNKKNGQAGPPKQRPARLVELEARQASWMKSKGPKLTDKELEELCSLRSKAKKETKT